MSSTHLSLIHFKLNCCGVDGYADWTNPKYDTVFPTKEEKYKVPLSCCSQNGDTEQQQKCMKDPEKWVTNETQGCYSLLYDTLENNKYTIGIGTSTLVLFMVSMFM